MIIDNVSYTFSDYPVYQLDSNLRNFTASVPGTYTIAVSGDNQSQLIEFKVPKTYEGVSLNNYTCYVNYTTSWLDSEGNPSNGSKIIYQIENTNDDYLHYGWILDSAQTYKAGRVVFGLSWKSPGTSTYLFNTLISSFLVLDGLGIQPAYVSESDADKLREEIEVISQSLSELTDIVNNMVDQTYDSTSTNAQSGKAVAQAIQQVTDAQAAKNVKSTAEVNEKVKGLMKEVTTPTTFIDSDGESIRNLKVLGASIQSGTPTPTVPIAIENTGDTLKLTSCGKNLINFPTTTLNGSAVSVSYNMNLSGNLFFKGQVETTGSSGAALFKYTLDGVVKYMTSTTFVLGLSFSGHLTNITLVNWGAFTGTISNVQLELGSSATSYEPYQGNTYTIPLTDINGTSHIMRQFDEVKKHDDGKWYFDCNSAVKSFDGTESIYKNSTDISEYIYYYPLTHTKGDGFCNRLTSCTWAGNANTYTLKDTSQFLAFNIKDVLSENTVLAVKAKLAEWNTAGNPLTFLYQTTTTTSYELSTETAQKLESIYSQKGMCNIYFTNDVTPSGSFEYVQALEVSIVDVGNEYFYKIAENSLTTPATVTDSYGGKLINEVITGKSEQAQIAGTNLLPYPYSTTTTTQNGITFTDNGDGTITVNGIATADITFQFISNNSTILNGNYTLSGCPIGGGYNSYYLQVANKYDLGNTVPFAVTNTAIGNCFIVIKNGVTINNLVFKPQLQTGSTATAFVQPTSGMGSPSPNYPQDINNVGNSLGLVSCKKNMLDYHNYMQSQYFTATEIENGLNVTGKYYIGYKISIESQVKITCSFNMTGYDTASGNKYRIQYMDNTLSPLINNGASITLSRKAKSLFIYYAGSTSITVTITNIQFEIGSSATSYEPYSGNTYTIPLTDINGISHTMRQFDKIKKHSDGKWYFDCNSHSVTLVGTEAFSLCDTNSVKYNTTLPAMLLQPGTKLKNAYCSHNPNSSDYMTAYTTSGTQLEFRKIVDNWGVAEYTLDSWKAKLAAWNTAGNPLTVEYQTANITSYELSASTSAILDGIAAQKGNANIYFTNSITPTMTADYPLDLKLYTAEYLTSHQILAAYAKTADLPTKTSDLINDSTFKTQAEIQAMIDAKFNSIVDGDEVSY